MAHIHVPAEHRDIRNSGEISAFLRPFGIFYERWNVDRPGLTADADQDAILAAYKPEVDALCRNGGYVTADVINVTPDTPGLDALLNKFNKEHRHTEDEVRFIVKGRGVFHINPDPQPVFAITVEAGDLINVPAGTRHWFDLCADRTIRAIRLFTDKAGWTPHYVESGAHSGFEPLCWGPSYIPPNVPRFEPAVRV